MQCRWMQYELYQIMYMRLTGILLSFYYNMQ